MVKFASQVEIIRIPVEDDSGKVYQKPYMRIVDFSNEETYIQLRNDLNVTEFSRILISALDYNTISVAAKFAPLKEVDNKSNTQNELLNKETSEELIDNQNKISKDNS